MYTKQDDYNNRNTHTGSYSCYNYLYHYLIDNYEPDNLKDKQRRQQALQELVKLGKGYNAQIGVLDDEVNSTANNAIDNFIANNKHNKDTGHSLGKTNDMNNTFKNIVNTLNSFRM